MIPKLFTRWRAAPAPAPQPNPPQIQTAPLPQADAAVAWFRLATHQGKPVTLHGAPPLLSYADTLDPAHAILAAIPAALPHICVLIAPDAQPFAIVGDPGAGIAASALILPTDTQGIVRLKYPLAGPAFLIAMEPEAGQGAPMVRFDGAGDTMNVAFALLPARDGDIPAAARALGTEIGKACTENLRAAPLLERLAGGTLRPELAEPIIRVMPRDELAELARLLLERPAIVALLARANPQTPWLSQHFPALARWNASRTPALPENLAQTPAAEAIPLYPVKRAGLVPTGLAVHCLARRTILPRRTACLLATAKNEGVYLLDWIAYHLGIGFEHIFLYTNDNTDGSDALLEALHSAGIITWIRNERGERLGAQEKAYAHALTMLPQILDYRWCAIIDLDEYVGFDAGTFGAITDFIHMQEAQNVDAIALCWQLFAAMPGDPWRDDFTPARLLLREHNADKHVKTILRPRLFWWSQPHHPFATLDAPFDYRTQDGYLHHHPGMAGRGAAFAAKPAAEQAWINHYIVRTADEVLWKWHRGRANWLDRSKHEWFLEFLVQNFLQLAQPERLVRDDRLLACAAGQGAVKTRLLALPGVAGADSAIKAHFTQELGRIRSEFLQAPPSATEHEMVRQFRAIVAGQI